MDYSRCVRISRLNYLVTTVKLIALTRVRVIHDVWYIAMNICNLGNHGRVTILINCMGRKPSFKLQLVTQLQLGECFQLGQSNSIQYMAMNQVLSCTQHSNCNWGTMTNQDQYNSTQYINGYKPSFTCTQITSCNWGTNSNQGQSQQMAINQAPGCTQSPICYWRTKSTSVSVTVSSI